MCDREGRWLSMTPAETRATFFTRWDAMMLLPLHPPSPCAALHRAVDIVLFTLAVMFFVWLAWALWPEAHEAINHLIEGVGVGK